MNSRNDHLSWCKKRALAYVEVGDFKNAVASMSSDLGKHPETASSAPLAAQLGFIELMNPSRSSVTSFINDFN